jgi:hypothetical protein
LKAKFPGWQRQSNSMAKAFRWQWSIRWKGQGSFDGKGPLMAKPMAFRWPRSFDCKDRTTAKTFRWQKPFKGKTKALRWQRALIVKSLSTARASPRQRPFDGKGPSKAKAIGYDSKRHSKGNAIRWHHDKRPSMTNALRWQTPFDGKSRDLRKERANCITVTSKHPLF